MCVEGKEIPTELKKDEAELKNDALYDDVERDGKLFCVQLASDCVCSVYVCDPGWETQGEWPRVNDPGWVTQGEEVELHMKFKYFLNFEL